MTTAHHRRPALFLVAAVAIAWSAAPLPAEHVRISIGAVGQEIELARTAADAWAKKTGNTAEVVAAPNSTTDRLALYQQQLAASSADIDVYQVDVIWPGMLAPFFIDLAPYVPADEIAEHFPRIIANNTVDGALLALPFFTDAGLLYYRTDLLEKYGYGGPPATWTELTEMAAKIQTGERDANASFWGFVWQGNSYEGLTCDALEWVTSWGGGTIVDERGEITINNPRAVEAVALAASWIGRISPPGVTSYTEEEARGLFQSGAAAFMRNWPYAIAICGGADSQVAGKFDVTVLPAGPGEGGRHAATLGGWQLAVSRFSKHPAAAADLVRHMTSAAEQKRRAIAATYLPTRGALYEDAEIVAAHPFFAKMRPVFENAVARPSSVAKSKYNRVSSAFWTAVHEALSGQATAADALAGLEGRLRRVKGREF